MTRNRLIQAARGGDEEAIESLTLEDMDTYTTISRRIQKMDVFSLVDTYFMPYGVGMRSVFPSSGRFRSVLR